MATQKLWNMDNWIIRRSRVYNPETDEDGVSRGYCARHIVILKYAEGQGDLYQEFKKTVEERTKKAKDVRKEQKRLQEYKYLEFKT